MACAFEAVACQAGNISLKTFIAIALSSLGMRTEAGDEFLRRDRQRLVSRIAQRGKVLVLGDQIICVGGHRAISGRSFCGSKTVAIKTQYSRWPTWAIISGIYRPSHIATGDITHFKPAPVWENLPGSPHG
jgi:hypothetical protein